MIETQNKNAVTRLAKRSFKVNRFRNMIAVLAIALTAVLFTTVFTIGLSLADTLMNESARMTGGRSDVDIKKLTREEADRIKEHPLVKEYGFSEVLGFGANPEYSRVKVEVRAANDIFAERFFAKPTTGRMPETENEIAMDTLRLDDLGIPHKIGETVHFQYDLGTGGEHANIKSQEFVLSGYWEGDSAMPSSEVWVSQKYIEQVLNENQIDYTANREQGNMTTLGGMYHISFTLDNKLMAESQTEQILKDCEIPSDIRASVNTLFTQLSVVPASTVAFGILGILAIMFIGYLLIFNIFQISIVKDIRFYGLLKTIGTTGKQIRKIIRWQAWVLASLGIPLGMLAGYLISVVLVPVISSSSRVKFSIVFHPAILLFSAVFALITVMISCRKPAKMAAKISPVEAVKFAGQGKSRKDKAGKPSTHGGKVWRMALRNLGRNKKKTALVMISLCLSLSIFNYIFINTRSFDLEKYINMIAASDFYLSDKNYLEPMSTYNPQADTVNDDLMNYINQQPGVEGSGRITGQEALISGIDEKNWTLMSDWLLSLKKIDMYKNDPSIDKVVKSLKQRQEAYMNIFGYDPYLFTKMTVYEGTIDQEKLDTGNFVIMEATLDDYGKWSSFYTPGDKVNIAGKTYEVLATAKAEGKLKDDQGKFISPSNEAGQGIVTNAFLPYDEYIRIFPGTNPIAAIADVKEEDRGQMSNALNAYIAQTSPDLAFESLDDYLEEFSSSKRSSEIVGYTLSIVLALIGILNFLNTTVTGIYSRKKELAMLQSIGMTGRQLKKMLLLEGIYHVGFSTVFMAVIGNLIAYFAIAGDVGGYTTYHFSIIPILVSVLFLGAAAIIIPMLSYRNLNRASIVERLREAE